MPNSIRNPTLSGVSATHKPDFPNELHERKTAGWRLTPGQQRDSTEKQGFGVEQWVDKTSDGRKIAETTRKIRFGAMNKKSNGKFQLKFLRFIAIAVTLSAGAAKAQPTITTTTQDSSPIVVIPTSPFTDGSAIKAQEDRFRQEGAMLNYGVNVADVAKTSLGDFQTKLNKAIAVNSYEDAAQIMTVGDGFGQHSVLGQNTCKPVRYKDNSAKPSLTP